MSDDDRSACAAYVGAAAELTHMPLSLERARSVAVVMERIASFAADLRAFPLADDIEIAGVFTP